jgi:benzoyl-CoA reductase/2-hydroxyglutaryl-CoA dehydratase subunit BcrC/BadD/HgdB
MTFKAIEKINDALQRRPDELSEARATGAKVAGWLNYNIPEEIPYALGLIPIRLGTGGNEELVELGARYISTKNCVFVRQAAGLFAENLDPYIKNSDIVLIDATCLQVFRLAEIIKFYFKVNTLVLGVPRNSTTYEGHDYYKGELKFFTEKLEEYAGRKLEKSRLEETIALYRDIRNAIVELYYLQAAPRSPLKWTEVYNVVLAGNYLDRIEYLKLLKELIREVKSAEPVQGNGVSARIFLSGSLIPPKDVKLINIIEQAGGRFVGDDLWSGLNNYYQLNVRWPTIDSIADAYLDRPQHASLPYLDLETDGRLANLKKLIKDFKADGIVYHTLRYCDAFSFKANETKEALKESHIPFLEIHTEYAGSDFEAIRTRIEAFVEMLKTRAELGGSYDI